jgi:SAM-dependent methyltransferase
MKNLFIFIIKFSVISKILLKPILVLHGVFYKLSGIVATSANKGKHPKHEIIRYSSWFNSNISTNEVVLDIGCNTGTMTKDLARQAKFVYGLEIESKYIEEATRLNKQTNIKYICADATKFDYTNIDDIDIITLSNVLEHIENRIVFLKMLTSRVPFGKKGLHTLLIRVPMIDRDWITIYKKNLGLDYRLDNTHFTEYTFEQFKFELSECNINIISYHIRFGEIYAVCNTIP